MRYQWPSIFSLSGNKRVIKIERNAEFPARAEDEGIKATGLVRGNLQVKAKEDVDEVGEGLYVEFNEFLVSVEKRERPYGNREQSAQMSASQPWGKCERE